ncbi:hypothetical protein AB4099_27365 [Bosea sp. 2KB_26]|uniref:hypothetical protein n=1 Tax=Bosea sp. 2KB_26 TaxID=3237475 RepID=UPI003F8F7088
MVATSCLRTLADTDEPVAAPSHEGLPPAGTVYAFRTRPYSTFAPAETGRYSTFKVIGSNQKHVAIAVLDGVWEEVPTLMQAEQAQILKEHRFAHNGRLAVFGVIADWWEPSELNAVTFLGKIGVRTPEAVLAAKIASSAIGTRYSTLRTINYAAEGEWRWRNDRGALLAEAKLSAAMPRHGPPSGAGA